MTLDENSDIVSAQDYYPYGEIIANRSYLSGGIVNDKYKPACRSGRFTEKEPLFAYLTAVDRRDIETNYDYFSRRDGYARYSLL